MNPSDTKRAGPNDGKPSTQSHGQRTRGRELALKYLYHADIRRASDLEPFDDFVVHQEEHGSGVVFARSLAEGVLAKRDELDARIKARAKNWSLDRMAVIDRNILRIAIFEMTADAPTPASIVINEAVELGKKFSTAQSGKFINGVLDKIRVAIEQEKTGTDGVAEVPPTRDGG